MQTSSPPIACRVRSELTLRGLAPKDLAAFMGVTPNTVSRRLRGVTPFSAIELARLASWLDVPVERFFAPIPDHGAEGARS